MTTLLKRPRVTRKCEARNQFPPRPHIAFRTPSILCVDDDPDFQTAIELRMEQFAVTIDHAYHGVQGIIQASENQPDLILLDQAMPYGDGEYLLEVIKQNKATCGIPVIVLSGMRNPDVKNRLLQAGAEVFLHKPLSFDDLVHEISRFVDLRRNETDGSAQ